MCAIFADLYGIFLKISLFYQLYLLCGPKPMPAYILHNISWRYFLLFISPQSIRLLLSLPHCGLELSVLHRNLSCPLQNSNFLNRSSSFFIPQAEFNPFLSCALSCWLLLLPIVNSLRGQGGGASTDRKRKRWE